MDRKERIYAYMLSKEYIPLRLEELAAVLDVPAEDMDELALILDELLREGKIFLTKRKRYEASQKQGLTAGRLRCSGYGFFGFVTPETEDEADIYIHGDKLNSALDGDRVLVQIDGADNRTGRREGHVVRILTHGNTQLTGVIEKNVDGIFRIRPDSIRIYAKILAPAQDSPDARPGDRVLTEIIDYAVDGKLTGRIVKVLGDASSLKSNVDAILFTAGIQREFTSETLEQAGNIPQEISPADISGRLDLRDKLIFTIDGNDARDFDDAVSIDLLANGNYSLGVHIADVTHYVTPASPLDKEAFARGTSVYLPDRVIPMLPTILSNGICSLNPHVDRLTLSVFMEIDQAGKTVSFSLKKSVIRSAERMTYDDVATLLEDEDEQLSQRYMALVPVLNKMKELAAILHQRREERGSINFDFAESKIIVDDSGEPIDIVRAERKISHKIIEEFMLRANETIAEYAFWSELPFVYRVHEAPDAEKIRDLSRFVSNFGLGIKGKFDQDTPIHPKAIQQLLQAAAGMDEEHMISVYVLRSLMKAEYKPENTGHFGLSAKYYCHFTSPIRRYPDLAIHRILKDFLDTGNISGKYERFAETAAMHSSETERTAEQAERDTDDLMKTYYMSQFIGESFPGIISGITNFGIFVELENSVEGLIRLENIKDDFYVYIEDQRLIRGERTGCTYRIGDSLDVTLVRADLLSRSIDFIPTRDATEKNMDEMRKKSRRKLNEKNRKIRNAQKQTTRRPVRRRRKRHGTV